METSIFGSTYVVAQNLIESSNAVSSAVFSFVSLSLNFVDSSSQVINEAVYGVLNSMVLLGDKILLISNTL